MRGWWLWFWFFFTGLWIFCYAVFIVWQFYLRVFINFYFFFLDLTFRATTVFGSLLWRMYRFLRALLAWLMGALFHWFLLGALFYRYLLVCALLYRHLLLLFFIFFVLRFLFARLTTFFVTKLIRGWWLLLFWDDICDRWFTFSETLLFATLMCNRLNALYN